jgi:hypothetical protein
MKKNTHKSYSKFTHKDLSALGIEIILTNLFANANITPLQPSAMLQEILEDAKSISLDTEKARSEFLIAPILRELQKRNKDVFAVYSGFSFDVDAEKGLQGFCDYLLARLPLRLIPDTPIIAVVEAKLSGSLAAAVPQCAAEMYATRIWNEQKGEPQQPIYGVITTGDLWLFLQYKENNIIEVDNKTFSINNLDTVLGVWQYIINQYK